MRRRMDSQTRSAVAQWVIPSAILIFVLFVMLFNFSVKSKKNADNTVTENVMAIAETCARNLRTDLTLLGNVGATVAELLARELSIYSIESVRIAEVASKHSGAYAVYLCDEEGKGVNNDGKKISIAEMNYFDKVNAVEEITYLYTENDGIRENRAIIAVIPFVCREQSAHILLYYSLNNIEAAVKTGDFPELNLVALVDGTGLVMAASGIGNIWKQGDNVFETLGEENAEAAKRIKTRMGGHISGMSSVRMEHMENALIYVPAEVNDWTLIIGTTQEYIDEQIDQQWSRIRSMLYQLIAVILVFICVVVGINIASRMYSLRKQEQLEIKADTDLLTGLCNKLATERKIKEFIARNPNSQSMMFVLDIDNFKKINDTMGHAFGDEVLRSLGKQIGAIFRATDIVGRAGGDEFIIFLKNVTQKEDVRKEAKKVEDFFKDFKAGEYTKYSATASIGVAIYPEEGADFETIYKAADQALYKAKERGKNQLAFYQEKWAEAK